MYSLSSVLFIVLKPAIERLMLLKKVTPNNFVVVSEKVSALFFRSSTFAFKPVRLVYKAKLLVSTFKFLNSSLVA